MKSVIRSLVIYWDASAILSTLIEDKHSIDAQYWATQEGTHLMSTLSCSEVYAVLHRMKREKQLAKEHVLAALKTLESGPWRHLDVTPQWPIIKKLASKWSLRGADLWHLAVARTFQKKIPEMLLLTYDSKLKVAAQGESLDLSGDVPS